MARGWESKSVEEQVEQAHNHQPLPGQVSPVAVAVASKARERQDLELQRERILDERTSNPIRRAALEAALTEVEAKLASL
jgi:hypothetical protein